MAANPRDNQEKPKRKKTWTVMVYMAGDNNLCPEMIWAVREMYRVGTGGKFNLMVQFDPSAVHANTCRYTICDLVGFSNRKRERRHGKAVAEEIIDLRGLAESPPEFQAPDATRDKRPAGLWAHLTTAEHDREKKNIGPLQTELLELVCRKEGGSYIHRSDDELVPLLYPGPRESPSLNPDLLGHIIGRKRLGRLPAFRQLGSEGRPLTPLEYGRYLVENSADPHTLKEFIKWCAGRCKTSYYMLILSGHGSGAIGDFLKDENPGKDGSPSSLSIPHLAWALGETKSMLNKQNKLRGKTEKLNILGMDSCLMSMAEIGYELREHVDYLVGSEGFAFSLGWPYGRIHGQMARRDLDPPSLAESIARTYLDYYKDYTIAGVSVDQAAVDLKKWDALKQSIDNLSTGLIEGMGNPSIVEKTVFAHWKAQSYKYEQYVDLWDFCSLLRESLAAQGGLVTLCQDVTAQIEEMVIHSGFRGSDYQHSHGISVYFPWSSMAEEYRNLQFAQHRTNGKHNWCDFIWKYTNATRREPRCWTKHTGTIPSSVTTRQGEMHKFGGPDSNKFGGPDSNKFGGPDSNKTLAQADSMKNPPQCYYQDGAQECETKG